MARRVLMSTVALALFVSTAAACGSGGLERSETCKDEAQPARNVRVRSAPPPGAPETPPADAPEEVADGDGAFRPGDAEAVYCEDFADPFVLSIDDLVGHRLYAFGTQNANAKVPVLISSSVLRREEFAEALPELPAWSESGGVWAPAAAVVGDQHVLYYTTIHAASGLQCISVATSDRPDGPYVDGSTGPLVCPTELGGAIDPSVFTAADGASFLLWKNDGNCCDIPSRIHSQPLGPDGLSVAGPPAEILSSDQDWEGGVVEGPAMVEHGGIYFLFYSANAWSSASYAVGYATCSSPGGPCTKPRNGPWLASSEGAAGPGGLELFRDGDGDLRAVFHAWIGAVGYDEGGTRQLFTAGIDFVDGVPVTSS